MTKILKPFVINVHFLGKTGNISQTSFVFFQRLLTTNIKHLGVFIINY